MRACDLTHAGVGPSDYPRGMPGDGDVWRLHHAGAVVADLVVTGTDQPWLEARCEPREGFDAVRQLFADDVAVLEAEEPDVAALEAAQDRIQAATTLTYPDGRPVPEFLLHIDGDTAWWRWSDEPFD